MAVRILLVEDNDAFRGAFELLLSLRDDVELVGSVPDGEAAVAATLELKPDVVVMDYRLPGMDGVQATRRVREAAPGVAVVCLTGEADPSEIQALYAAGAVACLTKDQELEEIVGALVKAAA